MAAFDDWRVPGLDLRGALKVGTGVCTLLCALLTWGCATTSGVRGIVQASPKCGDAPRGSRFPAESAQVAVSCPDGSSWTATTDAAGRFYIPLDGPIDHGCGVDVSLQGFRPRHYLIGQVCEWETTPEVPLCHGATLLAHLVSSAGAAAKEQP